jgi:hypothetical protein
MLKHLSVHGDMRGEYLQLVMKSTSMLWSFTSKIQNPETTRVNQEEGLDGSYRPSTSTSCVQTE